MPGDINHRKARVRHEIRQPGQEDVKAKVERYALDTEQNQGARRTRSPWMAARPLASVPATIPTGTKDCRWFNG